MRHYVNVINPEFSLASYKHLRVASPEKLLCIMPPERKPTQTCFMHASDTALDTPTGVAHANLE